MQNTKQTQKAVATKAVTGEKPTQVFRAGATSVSIWVAEIARNDGSGTFKKATFKFQRVYTDKNGQTANTTSFTKNDISALELCLARAKEYVLDKAYESDNE